MENEVGRPWIPSDSVRSTAIPLVFLSLVEWCGVWIDDVTNLSERTRWNLLGSWIIALLDPMVACWTLLCFFAWRRMYVSGWRQSEAIWPKLEAGRPGVVAKWPQLSPVCQVGPIYSYFACVSSIWAPTINICNKTCGTMLVARVRVVCVKCDLSFLLFSEYWWSKWWFIDRQHAPKLRLLLVLEEKLGLRAEWIRGCCDVTIKQSLLVIKHIKFTLSSGNRSALFKTVVHLLPCFHL